jgi:hypothetical protein
MMSEKCQVLIVLFPSEALPALLEHLAFIDKNITRPLKEYNDCQVPYCLPYIQDFSVKLLKELLKGTISQDIYFFRRSNILIITFCVCADGCQGLSKAFHYHVQLLTFYLLF